MRRGPPVPRPPGRADDRREVACGPWILPVLDGLDEVERLLRGDALRTLNMSLDHGAPVIVTCREPTTSRSWRTRTCSRQPP